MRPRLSWLPLLGLPLAALLVLSGGWRDLGRQLDDWLLRLAAPQERYTEVLEVDIDDASLRALLPQLGPWPYRRTVYASLLSYLREANAALVVFDIVFSEPRGGDEALAEALGQRPDWVLAAAGLTQALPLDDGEGRHLARLSTAAPPAPPAVAWPALALPSAALLGASVSLGALGVVTVPLDDDGRLRRLPLLHAVGGRLLPVLPLAALMRRLGVEHWQLDEQGRRLSVGPLHWPLDEQGRLALNLSARPDAVSRLSWADLMRAVLGGADDRALRERLRGSVVFVGSSAFHTSQVLTPAGRYDGTTLLAAAYAALGREAHLQSATPPWQAVLWLLAAAPALWGAMRARPQLGRQLLLSIVALGLMAAVAAVQLSQQRVSPLLGPLTALGLSLLLTTLVQVRWASLANRRLRHDHAIADAANHAKSQLLANVSHEIRTPMHGLLGTAELLDKTELDPGQRRYVEVIRHTGQTLLALINDLLDVSAIEAGHLSLSETRFELRGPAEHALALLQPRADAQRLALRLDIEAGADGWVQGDPKRLEQVLLNLLGNALKFTREGSVSLSLRRQADGQLLIEVRDTGIGIAPAQQEQIFERFVQADGSATRLYGGSGLGLSICRSLVQLMGGRIWLDSEPERGSTFHVLLPLPAVAPPETRSDAPEQVPAEPALPPQQVLLCEDNPVNVLVIEAMLEAHGHQVSVAENGAVGLQRLRERTFDLVLMDLQMPVMDGHSATRALRRLEAEHGWPRTPVIALTADAFECDARASQDAGCDAHLTKPISQAALLQVLRRYGRHVATGVAGAGAPRSRLVEGPGA